MQDDIGSVNSDPNFNETWREAAKVIIDDNLAYTKDETITNAIIPLRKVRLITVAGSFYQIYLSPFGLDKNKVLEIWKTQPSAFERLDITTGNDTTI